MVMAFTFSYTIHKDETRVEVVDSVILSLVIILNHKSSFWVLWGKRSDCFFPYKAIWLSSYCS